jgi:hypothetical protein
MADVDQLIEKASSAFEAAMALYGNLDWSVSESEGNFTLSRMPSEVGVDSVKVEYFVEGSPRTIGRKLFENISELSARVSENAEYYRVIQRFSDDTYSAHFRLKGVAVVSPREVTVFAAWLEISETTFAIISTSVTLPEVTIGEDAVLGELLYDLHLFNAGEQSTTQYVYIAKLDPKGSIPSAVVNTKISARGREIRALLDLIKG